MTDNIHFIYNHCTPEDFKSDVSFNEENFSQVLEECFLLDPTISNIEVFFDFKPGQATEKFSCAVHTHLSRNQNLYVKTTSEDNFAQTVINCCTKAVKTVRENKDRNSSSKVLEKDLEE